MEEVWRDVVGYEGEYLVSNTGRIMSLNCYRGEPGRIMRDFKQGNGYRIIALSRNNASKHFLVHRLVAEAFLDNPNGYGFVNHKDENKANNCVDNLEWCSRSYNVRYSLDRHPDRKMEYAKNFKGNRAEGRTPPYCGKIYQRTMDGKLVATFTSVVEASKETGINNAAIIRCCKGRTKSGFGYIWEFAPAKI